MVCKQYWTKCKSEEFDVSMCISGKSSLGNFIPKFQESAVYNCSQRTEPSSDENERYPDTLLPISMEFMKNTNLR